MKPNRRKTFEELVTENKMQLLADDEEMKQIEERIEKRLEMRNQA
ncbi:FbpB family small basic protein [Ectobacillus polymachus]